MLPVVRLRKRVIQPKPGSVIQPTTWLVYVPIMWVVSSGTAMHQRVVRNADLGSGFSLNYVPHRANGVRLGAVGFEPTVSVDTRNPAHTHETRWPVLFQRRDHARFSYAARRTSEM